MKIGTLVKIDWVDACHPNLCKWLEIEEVEEWSSANDGFVAENIGWIVYQNKDIIVISPQRTDDAKLVSHIQLIPKGCIKKIKEL